MPRKKTEEIEQDKIPWWDQLATKEGKIGKAVLSKCCSAPISCPRCGYGWICDWRCIKCGRKTDEHGLLMDDESPVFADTPSHGLDRKDKMAGNAYQTEIEDVPF
jgi:hypothetical protein